MKDRCITPNMTVLEVIDRYRNTESVLKKYDEKAGVCICCQSLFEILKNVSKKYGIDLDQLMTELEAQINGIHDGI